MFPAMLRRDVLILLAAKAAALTLIYALFVAPATRPAFSARDIEAHILSTSSTLSGHHDGHR